MHDMFVYMQRERLHGVTWCLASIVAPACVVAPPVRACRCCCHVGIPDVGCRNNENWFVFRICSVMGHDMLKAWQSRSSCMAGAVSHLVPATGYTRLVNTCNIANAYTGRVSVVMSCVPKEWSAIQVTTYQQSPRRDGSTKPKAVAG